MLCPELWPKRIEIVQLDGLVVLHPLLLDTAEAAYVHVREVGTTTSAFASSLGKVFHARPDDDPVITMRIEGNDPEVTPYASCRSDELSLHTDYATFAQPPRFTITRCIEPDPGHPDKGSSIVIKLDRVLAHLRTEEPTLYRLLRTKPVPFRRNAEHARFHPDTLGFTILDDEDRVRFDRTLILPSLEMSDWPDRQSLTDAVLCFEHLCHSLGERIEIALDRDEALIIDNRRVVHSRGECTVHQEGERCVSRMVELVFLV